MLEIVVPAKTACCLLCDKEEIGSVGATGMQSRFFENMTAEVMNACGDYSELKLRRALDGTNPTPKSVEECRKAFEEEYADVVNCIIALDCMDDAAFERMQKIQYEKEVRWLSRLEEKEKSDE